MGKSIKEPQLDHKMISTLVANMFADMSKTAERLREIQRDLEGHKIEEVN